MARLVFPDNFFEQTVLFVKMKTKIDADGTGSVLTNYMTFHGIDLNAMDLKRIDALSYNDKKGEYSRASERLIEERDMIIAPVFFHMRKEFQYIKNFFDPEFMQAGNWGAPITTTGKINYPSNFLAMTNVFKALRDKYVSVTPPPNLLDAFLTQHGYDMAVDDSDMQTAVQKDSDALAKAQLSENQTENRNLIWDPIVAKMEGMCNFLMTFYFDNPRVLGDYGITVDSSTPKPKVRKTKLILGGEITLKNVEVGSKLKNTGTIPIEVFRGTTTLGTSVTVAPGDEYGIARGFSIITVRNPSTLETAHFQTMRT